MNWDLSPRVIQGRKVRLEPLVPDSYDSLCSCLLGEPEGWFSRMYGVNSPLSISQIVENCIKANKDRRSLTFLIRDLISDRIAGLSHFMAINEKSRQLEIGGTQIGLAFRRSHVNSETKLLMLKDAFERLKVIRVFFKVDSENFVSQKAVERIGATFEGQLRNDHQLANGLIRHHNIYSILNAEWPLVETRLRQFVGL